MNIAQQPRNPFPTVDTIILVPFNAQDMGVVLIKRRNPPHGWALPGGFIDYGESCEAAALREAKEETNLDITLEALQGVYSDPRRDPRFHTMSVVYIARTNDISLLRAGDDAGDARVFPLSDLPVLAFDHGQILAEYKAGIGAWPGNTLLNTEK